MVEHRRKGKEYGRRRLKRKRYNNYGLILIIQS
jgi:hypothetical protein